MEELLRLHLEQSREMQKTLNTISWQLHFVTLLVAVPVLATLRWPW